jgi:nucleotide-binding universal stress UspA family protein
MAGVVVIGYDASADARHAVDVAARVLRAETAVVLNVWHGALVAAEAASPFGAPAPFTPEEDDRMERAARQTAEDGAARARAAGLTAEAEVRPGASAHEIGTILLDVAEQRDAELVVVGRRGLSRVEAVVLGSVSDAVVRDGRRPVLVVPAPGG